VINFTCTRYKKAFLYLVPISDRMKVCSQTSRACPEEREDGIEF
jgi:hypothetical protein